MKKMLFGLLALSLSASIFAAETTEMTVEAKLQVLPATDELVIEEKTPAGGWTVVTGISNFDHGTTTEDGEVPNPKLSKEFRVRRKTNASLGVGKNVSVEIAGLTSSTGKLKVAGAETLDHTFTTNITNPEVTSDLEPTKPFSITSEIPLGQTLAVGSHSRTETVTVAVNVTP
ncbi:hypothetical protein [Candidatus Cetobacterium colombiensis]|uniref:Uncharacterized protein n=1 Tax=Candidatus Cetobacterium colombiensis TaxID=3073100 RepID=A0ABU4WC28_9FUSO|nr:hypothetical protein [Candidatus Cetobacterium colombiensis]MDX8336577.1 hypothetical protein [Candidatus Cetobacterium colombiensis]